jgi:hypothetical protein
MSQFRIPKNPKASFRKVEPPKYVPIEKTKARAFNADVLGFANSPYASIYENPNKAIERELSRPC